MAKPKVVRLGDAKRHFMPIIIPREVPALGEDGKPLYEERPVTDEVLVLDEDGEPVIGDDGELVTEQVPRYERVPRTNPDGSLAVDESGDTITDALPVTERVPLTKTVKGVYRVPLLGSLSAKELDTMNRQPNSYEGLRWLLSRYMPRDVVDGLTVDQLSQLDEALGAATADEEDVDAGE